MTEAERFLRKVTVSGTCWLWSGACTPNGYGVFWADGSLWLAHRRVYERCVGLIPEGMVTDHLCRVRRCVNPDHLEVVTNAENLRRGIPSPSAVNAAKTTCIHGHPLTPENIFIRPDKRGRTQRVCRICKRWWDTDRRVRSLKDDDF